MATYPEVSGQSDADLVMKAAGLIAASAAVATIRDVGDHPVRGDLIIDVTALEIDTTNEIYDIVLQGSPDAAFGTDTNIQDILQLSLGHSAPKRTDSNKTDTIGRYVLPFSNQLGATVYRYLRLYTVVAGTVSTGINYTARLGKLRAQ
jgi:hypothetical protein